jgi:hypothetical protein
MTFEEKWEKYKANGRNRIVADLLFEDCFEQLGENEKDQVIEEFLKVEKVKLDN